MTANGFKPVSAETQVVTCQYLLLTQQCTPGVEALSQIAIFSLPVGTHLTTGAHDPEFPGISALSAAVTRSVQNWFTFASALQKVGALRLTNVTG